MISKNFSRCLAKLCDDGEVTSRYLRYNNTCQELLSEFESDIKTEFGSIHITRGKVNSGTSFIQIQKKKVVHTFLNQLPSYTSYNISIPLSVKNASITIRIAFIRAFYDDEGCANFRFNQSTKEWKRNITLTSNSLVMLKEIKEILLLLGIVSNKIYRNKPQSSYDKSFVLSISGKNNFIRFNQHIGFKHPRKRKRLGFILASYDATPKPNPISFKKLKKKLDLSRSHLK